MTKVSKLHRMWMQKREYRKAYEQLRPEFVLTRGGIKMQVTAGLKQEQLAKRLIAGNL